MEAMTKYIAGAVGLIIILAGGYYLLKTMKTAPPQGSIQTGPAPVATSTYTGANFSVVYPADYTVDAAYTYDQVNPKKPIAGVKFTIPGTMATGTNLGSDTYISVEQLPRAKSCTGDIYLHDNVKAQTLNDSNGVTYSVATTSGAGAGNLYEEAVFALTGSSPCTAVRYYIHSSNIDNYTPGAVQPFDMQALLAAFDTIRHSLVLGASAPAPTPATP